MTNDVIPLSQWCQQGMPGLAGHRWRAYSWATVVPPWASTAKNLVCKERKGEAWLILPGASLATLLSTREQISFP
jgi:hypothetical protein